MKNNCDFLPVWRDWPIEEWVCGGYRACVSLHVLSGRFACYLIRALQSNWKIDLVMLPYVLLWAEWWHVPVPSANSFCCLVTLAGIRKQLQHFPLLFTTFFKIHVFMLKQVTKNIHLSVSDGFRGVFRTALFKIPSMLWSNFDESSHLMLCKIYM